MQGYGAGSNDTVNLAQRAECGLNHHDLSFNQPCYLDGSSDCALDLDVTY